MKHNQELGEHHITPQNFIQLFGITSQVLTNWISRGKVKSEIVNYLFISASMINLKSLNNIPNCYKKQVVRVLKKSNNYDKYYHYFDKVFKEPKEAPKYLSKKTA